MVADPIEYFGNLAAKGLSVQVQMALRFRRAHQGDYDCEMPSAGIAMTDFADAERQPCQEGRLWW